VIDDLLLFGAAAAFDPRADAVTLMTLHAAKGLEFPTAFIVGVEEGLLPFTLPDRPVDIEEERRLFFVGMTRAKDDLFLLRARNRFIYGESRSFPPSRFLSEIPREYARIEEAGGAGGRKRRGEQPGLF
jgi:superfamily I DNA/RNA helicase